MEHFRGWNVNKVVHQGKSASPESNIKSNNNKHSEHQNWARQIMDSICWNRFKYLSLITLKTFSLYAPDNINTD